MPSKKLEMPALQSLYFGDRDIVRLDIDFRRSEGRISFSSVRFDKPISAAGDPSPYELDKPVLVLVGLRSVATSPSSARPETIILQWSFESRSEGAVAEFLVIGDPQPVTLRFECAGLYLEA